MTFSPKPVPRVPLITGENELDILALHRWCSDAFQWMERLTKERQAERLNAGAYTVENRTQDRSFDADATTVAELADVLGTLLVEDLKIGSDI